MNSYLTVDQCGSAEFKDRGSMFIGYIFPFAEAGELKPVLHNLRKEHPKAVHFCFAYRLGTGGNNFRSSDDGEPGGSAGKPILGQIDSKGITDVLIVVVRYFGGTLLGVPGLINAYKTASSFVMQVVPIVRKPIVALYRIQLDYTRLHEVLLILRQFNCHILKQQNQLFPVIDVGLPVESQKEVMYKLKELHNVELSSIV